MAAEPGSGTTRAGRGRRGQTDGGQNWSEIIEIFGSVETKKIMITEASNRNSLIFFQEIIRTEIRTEFEKSARKREKEAGLKKYKNQSHCMQPWWRCRGSGGGSPTRREPKRLCGRWIRLLLLLRCSTKHHQANTKNRWWESEREGRERKGECEREEWMRDGKKGVASC